MDHRSLFLILYYVFTVSLTLRMLSTGIIFIHVPTIKYADDIILDKMKSAFGIILHKNLIRYNCQKMIY